MLLGYEIGFLVIIFNPLNTEYDIGKIIVIVYSLISYNMALFRKSITVGPLPIPYKIFKWRTSNRKKENTRMKILSLDRAYLSKFSNFEKSRPGECMLESFSRVLVGGCFFFFIFFFSLVVGGSCFHVTTAKERSVKQVTADADPQERNGGSVGL